MSTILKVINIYLIIIITIIIVIIINIQKQMVSQGLERVWILYFSSEFRWTSLCLHADHIAVLGERREQFPISIAVGNVELMHERFLKHFAWG